MPGRFTGARPNFEKGEWDKKQRRDLADLVLKIWASLGGLQGDPGTPTEIQAGVDSEAGDSQAAAPANHSHGVDTAAPSVPIALVGPALEGSGTALQRADATNYLGQGGATTNDLLAWNGAAWAPMSPSDVQIILPTRIFGSRR